MADTHSTVVGVLRTLVERRGGAQVEVGLDSSIVDDLELDSLEVAEFSAALEDDLGRDPYSAGVIPRTVREVVAFYDK